MRTSLILIFTLAFFAFSFSSCNTASQDNFPSAGFIIVHASPDAPAIDVYASNALIDENHLYGDIAYNYNALPSIYNFIFADRATGVTLLNENINFEGLKNYSIFMIDSLSKFKTAITTDELSDLPTGDSVKIRFLQFSPDAGALDVVIDGGDTLYLGRSFNDQESNLALQNFKLVPAGNFTIDLLESGTTNLLKSTSVNLTAGNIYTLFSKGFNGSTSSTNELSLSTIQHTQ